MVYRQDDARAAAADAFVNSAMGVFTPPEGLLEAILAA